MTWRLDSCLRFAGVVLALSACTLSLHGCCPSPLPWQGAPERPFVVEDLLIDESALPDGWSMSPKGPDIPAGPVLGEVDSVARIHLLFYSQGGVTLQEVQRFPSERQAAREYAAMQRSEFRQGWETPPEITYGGGSMDQFHVGCGDDRGSPFCGAIWREAEYFVYLSTHAPTDYMSFADVDRLLQAIDERISERLSSD